MSHVQSFQKVALTIAGSDPSGGAGIQADIKTFTAIGVYAGAVIGSLTVQNTRGVYAIQTVDAGFVKDQIDAVLSDLHVSHVKIGMLGSSAVAESVCDALSAFSGEIIYDPVLVSSSGQRLMEQKGLETVRQQLLGICTVVTPNFPELSLLSEKPCGDKDALSAAAETLLQRYAALRAVIVTGGHYKPEEKIVTDSLFSFSEATGSVCCEEISHPRIKSRNTHGTGCTFSAAFTGYHLLSGNYSAAFQKAAAYMDAVIRKSSSFEIGHGTGPLVHHVR